MIAAVYDANNTPSRNMAEQIISKHGFREEKEHEGMRVFERGKIRIYQIKTSLVYADFADELDGDIIYFLSSHSSAAGRPAMTAHATGNWTSSPALGGRPKTLSVASPAAMIEALRYIEKIDTPQIDRTYEATHHGPTLKKPSLFVEVGGDAKAQSDKDAAILAADAFYESMLAYLDNRIEYSKAVIGVGGVHYPEKFTSLALEKGYAFGHIMPKHSIINADGSDNLDMLEQAILKSQAKVEGAVIDWKSVGAPVRASIVKKLNELGLEYERV